MFRHCFSVSAVLALGVLFLAADASQAQILRGRRGGSGFRDGPYNNSGNYYYYRDAAGNPVYYNSPMVRYGEPGMFNYMPSNSMTGQTIQPAGYFQGQVADPNTGAQQSFYSGPPNAVLLDVRLPSPDAQVLIDGTPTRIRGTVRQFYSPPLEPGKLYTYELTAKFMDEGKEVTRTQKQEVRAGQQYTVDFTRPLHHQP